MPETILLIEDNLSILKSNCDLLEQAGYRVLTASTAQKGLELAQETHPDLILLHVLLSDGDGVEVFRRFRAEPALENSLVVLMYSRETTSESQRASLEAVSDDSIVCPIADPEFLARIRALLRVQQTEQALRESETRYRNLFERSLLGIYRTTPEGKILMANPTLLRMLGYDSFAALAERDLEKEGYRQDSPRAVFKQRLARDGVVEGLESIWIRADGALLFVRENARAVRNADGEIMYYEGTAEDVTTQVQQQVHIERLNTVLAAVRDVNQLIVREKDRLRLLEQVCTTLVESRGYDSARIVLCDADGVPTLNTGAGPVAVFAPWNEQLRASAGRTFDGLLSGVAEGRQLAALPLVHGDQAYGWFMVCLPQGKSMAAEERTLFQEIAGDIAFALHSIDLEEQRQQAVAALRYERDLLHTLMDNIPDTIYFKDAEGHFTRINAAQAETLGVDSVEEVVGHTDFDYFTADHAQEAHEDERQIVASGRPLINKAERIRRADGEFRWVSVTKVPIKAIDGTVTGIVGVSRDMTAQVQAQESLRESQALFQSLVESMPQSVFSKDLTGRFTFANQRYCEGEEKTLEEILGKTDFDLHPPELAAKYRADDRRVIETGQTLEMVEVHQPLAGAESYVQVIKTPLYDAKGRVRGLLGMFWDITERMRAEKLLAQRVDQLAMLNEIGGKIAAALDLDMVLDRAAQLLHQTLGYHHVGLFTLDHEKQALVMQTCAGDFAHLYAPDHHLPVGEGIVGWVGEHGETLLTNDVTADPHYVNLYPGVVPTQSELSVPIVVEEKLAGVLDVQSPELNAFDENDVLAIETLAGQLAVALENARLYESVRQELRERRQAEEQLRHQERLAAVGQLAGGIAHDFNNLLAAILLYAQLALTHSNLPPQVVKALRTIVQESNRAAELVEQILDFSRRSMIDKEPLDLGPFMQEVAGVLRRTLPEHINLRLDLADDSCVIEADSTRIQQLLLNLATNARDAMPEGGEISIGLSPYEVLPGTAPPVMGMPAGNWIRLTFADTGTGMTEEVQAHIFEPFFTTKEPGAGTGLGLAQVHGIVKQHEGYIDVNTTLGLGATFRVYFPCTAQVLESETDAVSSLVTGHGETLLLVEDAPLLRQAAAEFLEELGYQVLTAAHGREALATMHSEPIDLLITDVIMPEMGGKALLRALQAANTALPVLAITGYVVETDVRTLKDLGFVDVLRKPFDMEQLATAVHHALQVVASD